MSKVRVKAECDACNATGVYCGFAEPKGVGVVCLQCGGSGSCTISYTPFVERKRRAGVQIVRRSRGNFIATGVGPTGSEVTYQEFVTGKMPK